jgi:hypothetical protein
MPGTTSSIPAVTDALIALFRNSPNVPKYAHVLDGWPDEDDRSDDDPLISIGGAVPVVANGSQQWGSIGRGQRVENYTIAGTIECWRPYAGAQKEVRDEAFAILAVLEDELRADPSLGGIVISAQVGQVELSITTEEEVDKGRRASVTFEIEVNNRLMPR